MKHIQYFLTMLIGLSALLTLPSCTNSSDDHADLQQTVVQNNVQAGEWRITSFMDSGKDETSHFSGYTFSFGSNRTLTSTNGSINYSGSWSITHSNSNDDSPHRDLDFNILFNLTNQFEDISEDWQIVSQSSTRIELIHISGGNGGTEYLTFERM
jgi:hypothetical protein